MNRRSFVRAGVGAGALAHWPGISKTATVQIGVCAGTGDLGKAERWGFDYLEPAAAAIAALSDPEFERVRRQVQDSRLRCRAFNSLIRTMPVVGPDANLDAVANYLDLAVDRCRQLGARVVVWGSASSRNIPPGRSREQTWGDIKQFLQRAGEIAKSHEVVIGIEPLRKQESNIINTGAEALQLVDEVKHPNVQMILDYYHLRLENEDPEILVRAREHVVHLHFANPSGRRWPRSADEDPEYRRFFQLVRQIGYSGGLSIEARGTFEEDAATSLGFLRSRLS
ncbi:MAG TPA: sugar phosphate isomerase/epimerase family protein [Bryobacteraceae bacterium]|nr:sugar phosphate isomerase/epimerase family protein [Bryobacteraceae bacterium]